MKDFSPNTREDTQGIQSNNPKPQGCCPNSIKPNNPLSTGNQNGEGGGTGEAHPLGTNPGPRLNIYNTPKAAKSHCAPEPGRLRRKPVTADRKLNKNKKGSTPHTKPLLNQDRHYDPSPKMEGKRPDLPTTAAHRQEGAQPEQISGTVPPRRRRQQPTPHKGQRPEQTTNTLHGHFRIRRRGELRRQKTGPQTRPTTPTPAASASQPPAPPPPTAASPSPATATPRPSTLRRHQQQPPTTHAKKTTVDIPPEKSQAPPARGGRRRPDHACTNEGETLAFCMESVLFLNPGEYCSLL